MPDQTGGEPLILTIEPMTPADREAVRAIYLEGITTGHATFETDAPDYESWDRGRPTIAGSWAGQTIGASSGRPWARCRPARCTPGRRGKPLRGGLGHGRGVGKSLLSAVTEASERVGIWTRQGSIFPENSASFALVKGRV